MSDEAQTVTSEKRQVLQSAFLAAYSAAGSISEAAKVAGCSRETHYRWMREDPTYPARFQTAFEESADSLEDEAHRRAHIGSDTLLIFLLKGKKPERFREQWKGEISGPNSGPIPIDLTKLTDEQLEQLNNLAAAASKSSADPS